jgi:opacity protein-like surface antigen
MKTYVSLLTVISFMAISSSVMASGADSSAYQGALLNGDSTKFYDAVHSGGPRLLSIGVGMQQQKRAMQSDFGTTDIKINHLAAILGVDVTKWLTLYGGVGEADYSTPQANKSSNFEWTAGGALRVLDYMVLEPWNDIDQYWVGVDINSFFRNTTVNDQWGDTSTDLSEVFASITMSFYSKNDKFGLMDRIGLYFGPAFSALSLDNRSEDQAFGFIGGIQLNPNPNMFIKLEVQKFDALGMGASCGFHF